MWPIEYTQEYEDWFSLQEEDNKMVINAKVILLSEFGPQLGRPYNVKKVKEEVLLRV